MKKYRISADTPIRTDYGIGLVAGLGFFPETQGFASSFKQVNDELDAAYTARRATRKPLLEKSAVFRFAHYSTDQTIRMVHRASEIADGGRRGPITIALFPDGLGPVVAPYGTRQIKPTEDLIDRLTRCNLAGVDAFRTEWKPKLDASLASLKNTAADHQGARDNYLDAFRAELALRNEHYLSVDKLMGLVRAAFPGDRAKQDLVFPVIDDASDNGEDEASGESTSDDAGKGGTP
jgi:hypothetical protein